MERRPSPYLMDVPSPFGPASKWSNYMIFSWDPASYHHGKGNPRGMTASRLHPDCIQTASRLHQSGKWEKKKQKEKDENEKVKRRVEKKKRRRNKIKKIELFFCFKRPSSTLFNGPVQSSVVSRQMSVIIRHSSDSDQPWRTTPERPDSEKLEIEKLRITEVRLVPQTLDAGSRFPCLVSLDHKFTTLSQ